MKNFDVSIVVVSYNTKDLTLAAIESVYEQTIIDFEIIVIDNASADGSAEAISSNFPDVKLICLEKNVGFAGANNLAVKASSGRFILLLNPDTLVLDHAIDRLVAFASENVKYGVYGGSTFFADGSRNHTAGYGKATLWSLFCRATGLMSVFRGSRFFDSESLAWWDWGVPMKVGIVTGCFMLLERGFWDEIGGFDERFHMYAEDADLSMRAAEAGRPCIIVPSAAIVHYGGASEPVLSDKTVRLLTAKVQLYRKHFGRFEAAYAVFMLKFWVFTRSLYSGIVNKLNRAGKKNTWKEIWQRRATWVPAGEADY